MRRGRTNRNLDRLTMRQVADTIDDLQALRVEMVNAQLRRLANQLPEDHAAAAELVRIDGELSRLIAEYHRRRQRGEDSDYPPM